MADLAPEGNLQLFDSKKKSNESLFSQTVILDGDEISATIELPVLESADLFFFITMEKLYA